jgi:capsular polysaccharide biosynthesis protein|tara:strand:- start:1520 stop:1696 length:177 start_codon:yes stop_codon:yes gene_type:complete
MQLRSRFKPKTNRNLIIKIILVFVVFFLVIFLLDKIDFPAPKKLIKQEISNDQLTTLK